MTPPPYIASPPGFGVHALKIGGEKTHARAKNTFTKAGSETLDLILQLLQHA